MCNHIRAEQPGGPKLRTWGFHQSPVTQSSEKNCVLRKREIDKEHFWGFSFLAFKGHFFPSGWEVTREKPLGKWNVTGSWQCPPLVLCGPVLPIQALHAQHGPSPSRACPICHRGSTGLVEGRSACAPSMGIFSTLAVLHKDGPAAGTGVCRWPFSASLSPPGEGQSALTKYSLGAHRQH